MPEKSEVRQDTPLGASTPSLPASSGATATQAESSTPGSTCELKDAPAPAIEASPEATPDQHEALGAVAEPDDTELVSAPPARAKDSYRGLGLGVVAAGLALAAAPLVSWQAAKFMEPLGNPQVPAGTLIVSGLVLFGLGVLRRTLASLHGEVEYIANETPLLTQISNQGRKLEREFSDVDSTLGASRKDMETLQGVVERLMELATNPEFEVSLFRMAASLDQLGARLDVSMKDRFKSVQVHLEGLQQKSVHSTEELTAEFQSLAQRLKEQDAGRREGELETREQIAQGQQAIEHFSAEISRLEGAVSQEFELQLGGLREEFASSVRSTAERTGERLDQCAEAIAGLGGELGKLEDAVAQGFEQRLGNLREQLSSTLQTSVQESAQASGEHLDECMQAITSMAAELEQVRGSLTDSVSKQSSQVSEQLTTGLGDLSRDLQAALEGQTSSIAGQFEQLEARHSAFETGIERQSSEFREHFESHRAQVDQTLGQRCDALANDMTAIAELVSEASAKVQTAAAQPAAGAYRTQPAPLPEADAEPRGALPFGHDVHGEVQSSGIEAGLAGPLPAPAPSASPEPSAEAQTKPQAFDYPIERLGYEFGDGWTDG